MTETNYKIIASPKGSYGATLSQNARGHESRIRAWQHHYAWVEGILRDYCKVANIKTPEGGSPKKPSLYLDGDLVDSILELNEARQLRETGFGNRLPPHF